MGATRVTRGAICLSASSHLVPMAELEIDEAGDIAAGTGQARDEAWPDRVGHLREHDRHA